MGGSLAPGRGTIRSRAMSFGADTRACAAAPHGAMATRLRNTVKRIDGWGDGA